MLFLIKDLCETSVFFSFFIFFSKHIQIVRENDSPGNYDELHLWNNIFVVLWLLVTISGFRLCLSCLGWSCLRNSLTTFLKFWLCCQKEFIQLHKRYRNDEVGGYCWRNTKQNFSIFISCCLEFVFFWFACYICNNNNTDLRAYNLVYVHAFVIIFKNVYIEILLRNSKQVKELKIHSEKLQTTFSKYQSFLNWLIQWL